LQVSGSSPHCRHREHPSVPTRRSSDLTEHVRVKIAAGIWADLIEGSIVTEPGRFLQAIDFSSVSFVMLLLDQYRQQLLTTHCGCLFCSDEIVKSFSHSMES